MLSVATATIVSLGLLLAGSVLMRLLHFSSASLVVAGGIVLLAYGIQTVVDTTPINEADASPSESLLKRLAIYPMGIPLILNPAGIAAAIIFSAEAATVGDLGMLAGVILAIAILDVVVLWTVRPIGARIPPEGIIVLEQYSEFCSQPSRSSSSSSGSINWGSSTSSRTDLVVGRRRARSLDA